MPDFPIAARRTKRVSSAGSGVTNDGITDAETTTSEPQKLGVEDSVFGDSFWRDTVPRLVREDPAVKAANEAVRCLMLAKQPSLMPAEAIQGEDHYSLALTNYGAALRHVGRNNGALPDTKPAILCAMFFVIFETIHGDKKKAAAHLYNGQRMMDEFLLVQSSDESTRMAVSLRKELSNLSRFLAKQDMGSRAQS